MTRLDPGAEAPMTPCCVKMDLVDGSACKTRCTSKPIEIEGRADVCYGRVRA